jgi:recombination protein RecR
MRFPSSIQSLINYFSTLPTVGPKTAERYVFYLLKQPDAELKKFAESLSSLKEKIKTCQTCFSISETSPCTICADTKRDHGLMCVVADMRDIPNMEATQYNGTYYVLGALLDTIEGVNPDQLNTAPLFDRLKKNIIQEIILALNPNVEGETTSLYLAKAIKNLNLAQTKITRLGRGLPMGADLEYADEITLGNALKYRSEI